ncbi:u-box domain protein [Ichthyophthirius multifiliis]|uniref:RING-type E3 ubiquitin transferase n=1 Tax=Ichthyophthirius multifiliis TaxID=5932 RepID=G0R1I7_ICHMU|nr:u-box domain protein [Ichthyophthirius multifiliis]EGR28660.1 u-box domain protein [Ichthyophthirius multifiliis]|eukprot:XP_004029896.1 u-box domain protein [Ichthyophthirius multifiliis]
MKGTQSFKEGNYDQAIKYYTKAIEIDSSQSVYFSNRGRCYKIQGNSKKAFEDAVQSIEIDDCNIKGQLLCGQILCELGKNEGGIQKIENGIKKLTRALTLCSNFAGDKKSQYEKEISVYIYRAKKLLWYKQQEEIYNNKIIKIDNYKKYLNSLNLNESQFNQELQEFIICIGNPYQQYDYNIPDYLSCKITLELMEDPYTTESGHTYEKEAIEDHIKRDGYIDPVNRQPIKQPIYPNQSIKQAVQDFLLKNPRAFEFSSGENYKSIQS